MGFSLKKVVGGSVGSAIGGAIMGPLGAAGGALFGSGVGINGLFPQRPNAPQLPGAPTLTAPQLPQYPGMSPETLALLKQQQQNLTGATGAVGGYQNNPYLQASGQTDVQALQNYNNALLGKIAPNQMISQQKQKDWEALKQQAGQLGIQLSGDTPEGAASQSTAGNQMITDFNKRYGALEQNYNLGQQQLGFAAQQGALGQQNTQFQNTLGGYQQLANQNQQLQNPYQQQTLGNFGVQTNQALSNADISNQNAMNTYQAQTGQQLANYNNALAGYNANMGLLQSGLGLAGQLVSAGITRGASGGGGGSLPAQNYASTGMGMNPGSYGVASGGPYGSYIQQTRI